MSSHRDFSGDEASGSGRVPAKHRREKTIEGIRAEFYKKLVKEVGYPVRRKRRINVKLAVKMHNAGWSYNQIGKHFKVSGCTVRRRLREAGID